MAPKFFLFSSLRFLLATCLLLNTFLFSPAATAMSYEEELHSYCHSKSPACAGDIQSPEQRLADLNIQVACQNYYQQNSCEDVKNSLTKENRKLLISCDPEKICNSDRDFSLVSCVIDGVKMRFNIQNLAFFIGKIVGAAILGEGAAVTTTFTGAPFMIYGSAQEAKECDGDMKYKEMLVRVHNEFLFPEDRKVDLQGKDKALLKMPCSDLNQFLQTRLDILAQKRADKKMWSLNPEPTRPLPPGAKALLATLSSSKCVNKAVMQQRICGTIASFAVGVGAGVGMTTIRNMWTKASASVAADTENAFETTAVRSEATAVANSEESMARVETATANTEAHPAKTTSSVNKTPAKMISLTPEAIALQKKTLSDLQNYLAHRIAGQRGQLAHSLRIEDGKGYLTIGYLKQDDRAFNALLLRAIKSGAIKDIYTGGIIGPKVLALINRLKDIKTDTGETITIHGKISPKVMEQLREQQHRETEIGQADKARTWSDKDHDDYEKAVKDLGVEEACAKYSAATSLVNCQFMGFNIEMGSGTSSITWSEAISTEEVLGKKVGGQ